MELKSILYLFSIFAIILNFINAEEAKEEKKMTYSEMINKDYVKLYY